MKSARAVDKSIENGFGGGEHLSMVAKIENLWKWAARALDDRQEHIQRYVSAIRVGEEDAFVWLTVKNTDEELRIYSLELMAKEKLASTLQHLSTDKNPKAPPLASFEDIIGILNRGVKGNYAASMAEPPLRLQDGHNAFPEQHAIKREEVREDGQKMLVIDNPLYTLGMRLKGEMSERDFYKAVPPNVVDAVEKKRRNISNSNKSLKTPD